MLFDRHMLLTLSAEQMHSYDYRPPANIQDMKFVGDTCLTDQRAHPHASSWSSEGGA